MKANDMKTIQSGTFKLNPVAAAIVVAMAAQFPANLAYANAGFGVNTDIAGNTIAVPTYYAGSPQGWQPALGADNLPLINPTTGKPYTAAEAYAANGNSTSGSVVPMINTGTALRKFVDPLAGAYLGVDGLPTAGIPMGIPVGITEKWVNPLVIDPKTSQPLVTGDDYYEIAVVEYQEQMHSDLAKPTRLRGYVQVETPAIAQNGANCANHDSLNKACTDITGIVGSEHIPGTYLDGSPILDKNGNQVYFVHAPHYLGPTILAAKGTPVRILFHNYLPYTDATGKSVGSINGNGGELPIPVDESIAGGGPVVNVDGTPMLYQGKPIKFSQNRVSIHWHGGDSPWTNDGTPHQWFAPFGDISYTINKDQTHPNGKGVGDAYQNVPDMPDPGQGSQTLYFPNNLSGRLMMYHDHASGITRLNAYIGEAAGYVVYDPVELTMAANALGTTLGTKVTSGPFTGLPIGLLDSVGIPLVIQDKTFVPKNIGPNALATNGQIQSQDAKWDLNHWGQEGDLFFPHVYETNQDPNSIDGTNPVGRWDWGPWFWPVFPAQYSLPSGNYADVTTTPEAFMDTPVVNGQAYPTLTVDPKTYRFRILSIGNDRTQNLGLYEAVDGKGAVCDATISPTPYPTAAGQTAVPATCTEVRMVPASANSNLPASWPTDGRAGGVPDPLTAGPDIVQIGSEGGLLPVPAVWPAQPVTYDMNVRSITVLNVLNHQLLLGGGERADVLVDFSKYAGKTLILYNDAPAPMPGYDPRIDYYTGVGDQTQGGGAYDTLPGYGPNTRTVMQFKVNATNTSQTGGSLDVAALTGALPVAYAATQPKPNIPETVYNAAFPNTSTRDNYAQIFTGSKTAPAFSYPLPGVEIGTIDPATGMLTLAGAATITNAGAGYTSNPTVTVSGGGGTGATASASIYFGGPKQGQVRSVTITNGGTGYTSPPSLVFSGGGAPTTVAAASVATVPAAKRFRVINKAIQELFDPVFGRMNATLAVELPFSSAAVATTIPLAYIDAPIDSMDGIAEGETQIWKITHNGVDSHPVHFHMVNAQVINRVGWDGTVKPPEANEVGWKETLRMNPLEDVYVAVKAVRPVTPFGVPRSARVLDPSQAVGSQAGFTQIDQLTGQAPTFQTQLVNGFTTNVPTTAYSNQLTDFDNEYVWHCHILGHEENDFMRPFIFHPEVVAPDAPGRVSISGNKLSWTDPTPYGGQDSVGIPTAGLDATGNPVSSPRNEIGFVVQQLVAGQLSTVKTLPANVTSWTDPSVVPGNRYAVFAYNAAGNSPLGRSFTATSGSSTAVAGGAAAATAVVTAAVTALPLAAAGASTAAASAATAAATAATNNAAANAAMAAAAANAPVAFSGANPGTTPQAITLTWANSPLNVVAATGYTNVTGFTLAWIDSAGSHSATATGTPTGATISGLTSGNSYTFTLVANTALGATGTSAAVTTTATAP